MICGRVWLGEGLVAVVDAKGMFSSDALGVEGGSMRVQFMVLILNELNGENGSVKEMTIRVAHLFMVLWVKNQGQKLGEGYCVEVDF
ncbi:hypothetical protein V6N12_032615 [Hibiscus sabdariffa]|uniref:Uncharacterized protein n=1 Tax=Hibiscus sabdariffa TaxID=183260 RepID=A0ABR2ANK7_9ROSI